MKRIGFVGVGAISGIYLENIANVFKEIEIAGVCDLIAERAEKAREKFGVHVYKDMHEMLKDPTVDIILNITRPYEHFDVTMAALEAGKHVYSEKPLGATLEEGVKLVDRARQLELKIGGAPDTFMGAGIQTCRKIIDSGLIGTVVGASAFMVCRGHESWHPDPEFYYKFGGGPMLDMGPYYLSALVNLLGPVKTVAGMAKASFEKRLITSQPKSGTVIDVDVPTYITGMMRFHSGAQGTIFTTFDAYAAEVPRIEIYGSEGTLSVPDPNTFGGPVRLFRPEKGEFLEFPLTFGYSENSRGLGLADMAKSLESGGSFRASSEITFHVLEIMESFHKSSSNNAFVDLKSAPSKPEPMKKPEIHGIL
ncbi:MAG: Gfo/Idh/MocA family oxidoreductase [Clostridiales bacterium]|jgi:predicted dehydrogenase|nr:Gfo/Idh/MocA family oxidoreductase [Clostridiales bacterium]